MAGKLDFSIAINLLTENFKKGTNTVKNAFASMQAQVLAFAAALGFAGVGLNNFLSQIIQVARETSKANTALKNISTSTADFANNLRFATELAQKYGAYVNDVTFNFAKFSAAANSAGMSLLDQRKIFESLTRASAAFSMSGEDTNGVFLAITQMMSKGKVSSEELRKQLGERLPVAMAAMAKAAGVPISQLDKLLQQGKLLSADVLPKFADALNELIPNVNVDNLETSINRLRNAFQSFADSTGILAGYKKLIDNITKLVQQGAKSIESIVYNLVAVLTGVSLGRFFKWLQAQLVASQRAAMLAAAKSAKAAGEVFDAVAWKAKSGAATISTAFTRAFATIRAAFMTMLPTAIFVAIGALVARIASVRAEAAKIRSIFSDYANETKAIGRPEEADRLQRLYKIAEDTNNTLNVRKNALNEINNLLGTAYGIDAKTLAINGDINTKVAERIKLLKDAAAVEFYQNKKLEAENQQREIAAKYGGVEGLQQSAMGASRINNTFAGRVSGWFGGGGQSILNDAAKFNQLGRVAQDAAVQLEKFEKSAFSYAPSTPAVLEDEKKKKTNLQKAEENYTKSLEELKKQLDNRAIDGKEYNKALDDLNKATYKTLSGLLTTEQAAKNKYFQQSQAGALNPLTNPLTGVTDDYYKELNKLSDQYSINTMTEEEYNRAKLQLIEKTLKEVAVMENLGEAGYQLIDSLHLAADNLRKEIFKLPELATRDTTFDYKKTDLEKMKDQLSVSKSNLDKIKEVYDAGGKQLAEELNNAMSNVKSLEEALKIAEVKQDVKDLGKELKDGVYSGVKDIASSSDRLVRSFESLRDVFSDEDASAWERIMAIWNTMINSIDAFLSIVKAIETITEVTKKLALAKEAEAAIDATATQQKIANAAQSMAADVTAAQVKKATASEEVSANTAAAASSAGKSAAALPFPINLIAIGAAIAGVLALFKSIPKFANGGIVQGSPMGDKNIVAVNGGEMILNGSQQDTLFKLANGKGVKTDGDGREVVFEIKGDALVGVLDKHSRKINRGK